MRVSRAIVANSRPPQSQSVSHCSRVMSISGSIPADTRIGDKSESIRATRLSRLIKRKKEKETRPRWGRGKVAGCDLDRTVSANGAGSAVPARRDGRKRRGNRLRWSSGQTGIPILSSDSRVPTRLDKRGSIRSILSRTGDTRRPTGLAGLMDLLASTFS